MSNALATADSINLLVTINWGHCPFAFPVALSEEWCIVGTMDYEALLRKYVKWVRECEGVSFIESGGFYGDPEAHFTPEGWAELQRIDAEFDAEQKRSHAEWLATRKP